MEEKKSSESKKVP